MIKQDKTAPPTDHTAQRADEALAGEIPALMESALAQYQRFAERGATEGEEWDAKGFSAHHAACKSALAHLESLSKLLAWAESREIEKRDRAPDGMDGIDGIDGTEGPQYQALIAEARAAIKDLEQEEGNE